MKLICVPRAWLARGLFVCAVLAAALLPGGCNRNSGNTVLVGHLVPRSGPDGAGGQRLETAVAIVVEEFNHDQANKIDLRPVTVIHVDTGEKPEGFGFQATRLIAVNKVSALIGGVNATQLARITEAVQGQTSAPVTISPCGGLAGAPSQLVWATGLSPNERGLYLARGAVEQIKLADVVTVTDARAPIFAAIRGGFESEFRHADRQLSGAWTFADAKELPGLAAKIAAAPRKALLFCGRADELLQLRAELRKKNLPEGTVYLFGGEEEEAVFRLEASQSNGIVYASGFTAEDGADKIQKFVTEFRNRTGQPPDAAAGLTADAARILFAAGARAGTLRREQLLKKEELARLELELPSGPFWFTKDGEPRRTAYLLRMEGGRPKLLATFRPEKK